MLSSITQPAPTYIATKTPAVFETALTYLGGKLIGTAGPKAIGAIESIGVGASAAATASAESSAAKAAAHTTNSSAALVKNAGPDAGKGGSIGEFGKIEVPTLDPKLQKWNIRPGQEWKEKVYGKAQKTGTEGHDIRLLMTLFEKVHNFYDYSFSQ